MKLFDNKGILLVLLTALISGVSIFVNSYAVKGFDSSVFTFSKNVVVAVLMFAVLLGMREFSSLKKLTSRQWGQLSLIGLIGGSIPFLLFFKGLQMTTGSTSGFIHKTLFVFVAVFALLFLKEKLSAKMIAAVSVILVGTYLMIRPSFAFSAGHFLVLGAVLFWALENVYAKYVLKELSGNVVGFGRMFFGSLFIFVFLLFTGKAPILWSMTSAQYLWIGLTSVFLLLYVFTYYNGLKLVKASTAAAVLALGAPITSLLTMLIQGKALLFNEAIGMLLIVVGVGAVVVYSASVSPVSVGVPHERD